MKQRLVLVIAVVMGLLAAFLTKQYLSAKDKLVKDELAKLHNRFRFTETVVFRRDMPQDTLITEKDIAVMQVPAANLRPGAIREGEWSQLVNKRTVNYVNAQAPVFWSDIEGGEAIARGGLANEILTTMRAISINVSGSASVSGQVRPNDRVDVIGTFVLDSEDRPNEKEQVTLTVLQNVTVLATGRETSRTLSRVSADRASSYSTVTLLVTPREAETLVACEQNRGKLTLALRNPADLGFENELPTVDFKFIRETLSTLNESRQNNLRQSGPRTVR